MYGAVKKKESTKELILCTASELFQRQGYHGTGLNQIIEESGAPKGSLYYHFPNGKEEIAVEAIRLMKEHVLEGAARDLAAKGTAVEAFQYHIHKIASEFEKKHQMEGVQIGLIASETAATHEALRNSCQHAYADWQALYTDRLIAFSYDKEMAKELAVTINAMVEGAVILALTSASGSPLYSVAKQLPSLLNK
ncbi:TetR/AcrR family transcriptional regulator, lmrAB and yxaGH operons repressor [Terribacillus halophilus]|uniref:TetR/AcrR family transcriptional regulator, lmrAB and yxaGH operons repressor n=1 Tax=Terribacillus halophilus TaxID=361279 RepID=A0A1G6RC59_9BACI|nr:TetR/AcrR family transcriptional regulator [Terribacillus halophilus]SDD01874.1 TetR/AcrR family transcriptional regulator, lmrAB and yxaGH operons repressor [Terribacillus halophilus]